MTSDLLSYSTLCGTILLFVAISISYKRDQSAKRSSIYDRIKKDKKELEEDIKKYYVRKDVHAVQYSSIESDVREIKVDQKEIKADVKLLLSKNGLGIGE